MTPLLYMSLGHEEFIIVKYTFESLRMYVYL